jgi:D-lactate dehydrogenase (cytochrome)
VLIKRDAAIITGYLEDASGFTEGSSDCLVIPENETEVVEYLTQASQRHESITLSAGGTGVTAGRIPLRGTLFSLERLADIGPIQVTAAGAEITVGPAVRLETLKNLAHGAGLIYGPDPTERTGTLGGNVATNASGGQCFKYGPTRQHVLGLTVALSTGETLTLRRGECLAEGDLLRLPLSSGRILEFLRPQLPALGVSKNAAGYFSAPNMDAVDLFIGMEGTLGVITSITLKLLPAPAGVFSLAVFFNDADIAVECAAHIRDRKGGCAPRPSPAPASLEFMDEHALNLLRPQFPSIPATARACLMLEQEFETNEEDRFLTAWSEFFTAWGLNERQIWFAQDDAGREHLRHFRHALPETVNTLVRTRGFRKVGTDMAVPDAAFPEMMHFYYSRLQASGLDYLIFGHIGECHLHVNVLPRDEKEYNQARALYEEFAVEAVAKGGTVSAEHGIGKIKHHFLQIMVGEAGLREMARVKQILDPALILNRGNIFPETLLQP